MIYYLARCSAGSKTRFLIFDRLGECLFSAEEVPGWFSFVIPRMVLLDRQGAVLLEFRRTPTPTGWRCSAQYGGSSIVQVRRRADGSVASLRTKEGRWRVLGDPRTGEYELCSNGETVLRCSHCRTPQGREAGMLEIFTRTQSSAALAAAVILAELPLLRTPVAVLNGQ